VQHFHYMNTQFQQHYPMLRENCPFFVSHIYTDLSLLGQGKVKRFTHSSQALHIKWHKTHLLFPPSPKSQIIHLQNKQISEGEIQTYRLKYICFRKYLLLTKSSVMESNINMALKRHEFMVSWSFNHELACWQIC